ncbi:hypothetical protein ACSVBT_04370 [Afipia sp. TerB]
MGFEHQGNRDRSNFGAILHPSVVVIIVKESLMTSQRGAAAMTDFGIRTARADNASAELR